MCYTCSNSGDKSFGTLVEAIGPSWPELQYIERAARGRKLLWIQEQIFKSPGQERPTLYSLSNGSHGPICWAQKIWAYLLGTKDLGQDQTLG